MSSGPIPPALLLPEILETVFAFLSQQTLRHQIRLVCKQWDGVARARSIQLQVSWIEFRKHLSYPRAMKLLPLAHTLNCTGCGVGKDSRDEAWVELWEFLSRGQIGSLSAPKEGRRESQLKALWFEGTINPQERLLPLLPLLSSLTKLRLTHFGTTRLELDTVLAALPVLQALEMELEHPRFHHPQYHFDLAKRDDSGPLPTCRYLQSLILSYVDVTHTLLLELLSVIPRLKVLCLDEIGKALLNGQPKDVLDKEKVIQYLLSSSSLTELDSFHLSIKGERLTRACALDLIQRLPATRVTHWGLTHRDLDRTVAHGLLKIWNIITSLDLAKGMESMMAGNTVKTETVVALHEFLCHSPLLLHLKASHVRYWFTFMDLNRPSPQEYGNPQPKIRKIWACRNLQTLDLSIQVADILEEKDDFRWWLLESRVVFGYLSTVCPRLRELSIHRHQLDLSLAGGFCLLSRMTQLEKLCIGLNLGDGSAVQMQDLEWMKNGLSSTEGAKSGLRRAKQKYLRYLVLHHWRGQLAQEENTHQWSQRRREVFTGLEWDEYFSRSTAGQDLEEFVYQRGDDVDEAQLRRIGRLEDVRQTLEKLSAEGQADCWPRLESIQLQTGFGGGVPGVLKMMRALRPLITTKG